MPYPRITGLSLHLTECRKTQKYLFPVEMMGKVFRGKMLHALGAIQKKGAFPDLPMEIYAARMATVSEKSS